MSIRRVATMPVLKKRSPSFGSGGRLPSVRQHQSMADLETLLSERSSESHPDPFGAPMISEAVQHAEKLLPHDPTTHKLFPLNTPDDTFEAFGMGVSVYMSGVRSFERLFVVLFLVAISNMVSNFYGGALDHSSESILSWPFTVTSIGNARNLTPAYGVCEFVMSSIMVFFLYHARAELRRERVRLMIEQCTPADFAVRLEGLPREEADLLSRKIERALHDYAPMVQRVCHVGVARDSRLVILASREYEEARGRDAALRSHISAAECALEMYSGTGTGSGSGSGSGGLLDGGGDSGGDGGSDGKHDREVVAARARLTTLREAAVLEAEALRTSKARLLELMDEAEAGWRGCCGVAFVSFERQVDALEVLKLFAEGTPLQLRAESGEVHSLEVSRPPEPSDVIWENLPVSPLECGLRQLGVALAALGVSLSGVVLIVASSYLLPELLADFDVRGYSQTFLEVTGTVVVIASYVLVFVVVPAMEVRFMRHKAFADLEVSTVLKLVAFQVLATVCTASVFVNTTGALNRDWYITGGVLITNGMLVDTFVINLLVQGLNLNKLVRRWLLAPRALTQLQMNETYTVRANLYVVDRLQILTKLAVLALMYSAALPLMFLIVCLVLHAASYVDRYNLLRVLVPPPQSDHAAVRCIIVYVVPVAILLHQFMTYFLFTQLHVGQYSKADDWEKWFNASVLVGLSDPKAQDKWVGWLNELGNKYNKSSSTPVTELLYEEAENTALNMVRLSFYCHTPIVLWFIVREWGREWGAKLSPASSLPTLAHKVDALLRSLGERTGELRDFVRPYRASFGSHLELRRIEAKEEQSRVDALQPAEWDDYLSVLREHQTVYDPPMPAEELQRLSRPTDGATGTARCVHCLREPGRRCLDCCPALARDSSSKGRSS